LGKPVEEARCEEVSEEDEETLSWASGGRCGKYKVASGKTIPKPMPSNVRDMQRSLRSAWIEKANVKSPKIAAEPFEKLTHIPRSDFPPFPKKRPPFTIGVSDASVELLPLTRGSIHRYLTPKRCDSALGKHSEVDAEIPKVEIIVDAVDQSDKPGVFSEVLRKLQHSASEMDDEDDLLLPPSAASSHPKAYYSRLLGARPTSPVNPLDEVPTAQRAWTFDVFRDSAEAAVAEAAGSYIELSRNSSFTSSRPSSAPRREPPPTPFQLPEYQHSLQEQTLSMQDSCCEEESVEPGKLSIRPVGPVEACQASNSKVRTVTPVVLMTPEEVMKRQTSGASSSSRRDEQHIFEEIQEREQVRRRSSVGLTGALVLPEAKPSTSSDRDRVSGHWLVRMENRIEQAAAVTNVSLIASSMKRQRAQTPRGVLMKGLKGFTEMATPRELSKQKDLPLEVVSKVTADAPVQRFHEGQIHTRPTSYRAAASALHQPVQGHTRAGPTIDFASITGSSLTGRRSITM